MRLRMEEMLEQEATIDDLVARKDALITQLHHVQEAAQEKTKEQERIRGRLERLLDEERRSWERLRLET